MTKQEKLNLFKLFATMKNTRESNTQGVGLGLCISRMIVEIFGGEIKVDSEPNEGTTFTFTFRIFKNPENSHSDNSNKIESQFLDATNNLVRDTKYFEEEVK
jgi:K+-sensing histidine kinase KdpD